MKLLIVQPKLEPRTDRLELELNRRPDADMAIFPEGYLNQNVEEARRLARSSDTILATGHRRTDEKPKDRAIVIDRSGDIVLERAKYGAPEIAIAGGRRIGFVLCDELVLRGLGGAEEAGVDLIVHPIGVGMFSDEQFDEWIRAARRLAAACRATIVGTSHADGAYRDSPVSIPIAYCIDSSGEPLFIAKDDVRTRIVDLEAKTVVVVEPSQ
ncbi:hypothetical protein [Paenibacillus sp. GYB003]|uniref:hypothetical protein n=1 Tax=Paenibacillus sp. GYB003 TaxID=2994392 RepID=UPI002F96A693